jgi:hypothetical protein
MILGLHGKKDHLLGKQLVRVEYENGNRLLPKIFLDDKTFQELCYP